MNYLTNRAKAKKVLISLGLILVFAQIFRGRRFSAKEKSCAEVGKETNCHEET